MEELTLRQMQEGALNILKNWTASAGSRGCGTSCFMGPSSGPSATRASSPGMTTWTWPCPGRILTGWWNIAAGTGRSFCPCT